MPPLLTGAASAASRIATAATLGTALALVFFYAPLDADQGFVQKIFYMHVPLAIVALCGFIFGGISRSATCAPATASWDMRSYVAIHMSLILGVGVLITGLDLGQGLVGPLVGVERADAGLVPDHRPAVRHLPAAAVLDRGPREAGALRGVFAIVAGAFVPLNFIAVRLAQPLSTRACYGPGGNLPGSMQFMFLVSLVGIALLYVTLWKYEMAAKHARMQPRGGGAAARRREPCPLRKERGPVMSARCSLMPPRCRCTRRASTSPPPTWSSWR